ncbi:MAG: acyltransferase [Sulfuricaulis sp.]|uniref:acyltransferase n=1 Tax=Sulfuricaulis sp. TaxID=2003553 RepID=UPI0034A32B97
MIKKFVRKWVSSMLLRLYKKMEEIAEADLPRFASNPRNLKIELPRRIYDAQLIDIGNDVSIGPGSLLVPQRIYPSHVMSNPEIKHDVQKFNPKIVIGNRVTSTGSLTIAAMQEVTIEDDVMIASNVLIADGMHGFENANEPYKYQKMWKISPIVIKRGCWIGQNVVIMPGVTVGELSIIGANSVVTKSVPDRCIAIGAPARIVKQWDEAAQRWSSLA